MKHLKCVKIILTICLFVTVSSTVVAADTNNPTSYDTYIQESITNVAEEYGIAPSLMMAIAEVESKGKPKVISASGDYGLMQINKMNHDWLSEELGITNWFDVEQNTEAACYLINWLRENYEECEDVSCCLMAYNMGVSNAKKLWERGIYESEYSKKVLDLEYEIGRSLDNAKM